MMGNYTDKNGDIINDGNTVMYNGNLYIVMNIKKDDIGYICHPVADNINNDINLADIHTEVEIVE